uniref:Uncharacterized protein n=1 Tax=Manihot esculenta TaxID=3983 RepID=A0A2C9UW55_MANES
MAATLAKIQHVDHEPIHAQSQAWTAHATHAHQCILATHASDGPLPHNLFKWTAAHPRFTRLAHLPPIHAMGTTKEFQLLTQHAARAPSILSTWTELKRPARPLARSSTSPHLIYSRTARSGKFPKQHGSSAPI